VQYSKSAEFARRKPTPPAALTRLEAEIRKPGAHPNQEDATLSQRLAEPQQKPQQQKQQQEEGKQVCFVG
jgi:hypothetical protein